MKACWLAALFVLVAGGLALCAPADPSLLSNPDFALDKDGDRWPDDWPRVQGASWENENGTRFLRLRAERPGQMIMLYRQVILPSPPPPALEIRLRLRTTDIRHGKENWMTSQVIGHFKDKAEKILKPEPESPHFAGTSDGWVEYHYAVTVPRRAHLFEFMPCLFQPASGTLDLAECAVFPATAYLVPSPPPIVPSETIVPAKGAVLPPELHVAGNQLQTAAGKPIWLQGLCVDSLEWSGAGENILKSIPVAVDEWKANVIRLPVREDFWCGRGPWQNDRGMAYRKIVDGAVEACAARGAYLVLDLHRFGAPTPAHIEFWRDAATRYKNHPAVLFELLNEPHDLSWKVWRDGGPLGSPAAKDAAPADDPDPEESTPGMQALVDTVRATGARNVVIAGTLDWSYDVSGVINGFALRERAGGNGIVYSTHIYPWKKGWQDAFLAASEQVPLFVGEVGCPADWKGFQFIPEEQRTERLGPGCPWPTDVLGVIQKHRLNWTGFSFHPTCGPNAISDWQYTPTPYWGTFVKEALAGKVFETKTLR